MSQLCPHSAARHGTWLRGVTLIEMMIVIAIVGVIAAIAVPNLTPMITVQRAAVSAEDAANLLDRARRKAIATGFCYRVRKVGDVLLAEGRTTPNCFNIDNTNWDTAKPYGRATPEPGVTYTVEASAGSRPATTQLVFRPNGRLYGDNDGELNVADDGGRIRVKPTAGDRTIDVLVQSNGRICAESYTGTKALPNPVVCGVGYGTTTTGNPTCSSSGSAELPAFAALLGTLLLRRRRRAKPASERAATRSAAGVRHGQARAARGYLLLEVMASGAILAIVLGSVVTSIATHRVETTRAARRAEAAGYAQQALAYVMSQMPPTCTNFPAAPTGGPITVTCAVANVTPVSTPPLEEQMFDVTITASYPAVGTGEPVITTHEARIRSRNRVYNLSP